jgi:pyoverdine/dityrosine biosynthesis protein Dit1/AcrR family transcriptional regulator
MHAMTVPAPDLASTRTRQRVLEAAVALLARGHGIPDDLLGQAAAEAACSPERARIYFRRDEDLVLALYARLAADLEARAPELPEGSVGERFHAAMEAKLTLLAPYRKALTSLLASLLDPRHELSALGEQTEIIRRRVMGVFSTVVLGATDRPSGATADLAPTLVRLLYAAHLAVVLLWTQDRTEDTHAARTALGWARDLLSLLGPACSAPGIEASAARLDSVLGALVEPPPDASATTLAEAILRCLFRHRRLLPGSTCGALLPPTEGGGSRGPCGQCFALHLPQVRRFVTAGAPVHFVLPAFPAKSSSPRKVLGRLPDKAEELALAFLENVCVQIRELYPPGARITICSDGRVFGDLVGVTDEAVTDYGRGIETLLAKLEARSLDLFHMEDLFETTDFARMRHQLCAHYAEPLERIEQRTQDYPRHRALFNGIHRFLFEERVDADGAGSRTQVREACKELAYRVIQRSDAWGRLVAECFPTSVRLSIHPQDPHSEKIGILLGEAEDAWMTPWHGVALRRGARFTFMKRCDAMALPGARVVFEDGRPSFIEVHQR